MVTPWSCWLVSVGSPCSSGPLFFVVQLQSARITLTFLARVVTHCKASQNFRSLSELDNLVNWRNMNSIAQNVYGEQSHTTMFLANSYILNTCRIFSITAASFPSNSLRGFCAGWWGGCYSQKWDLPLDRAAWSIHSARRNWLGAGSYFLPFKLLHTFALTFQPEMSYFLTTVQGSTSEILPSLGFTTPPHTHTIPSTPLQMPERTQCTCLNVRHPGSSWEKAKQYTNHMQQADLLLQFLFKTWLFVQAGFWNIWFGARRAEPTNWMTARCATTKGEKEGASGIIRMLDCFFQQVFFQFTAGHWHQKVQ